MQKLWVKHVKEAIKTGFAESIDLSDYQKANDSVREKAFLSRGLAALAVQRCTGLTAPEAAAAVVDGTGDNGLDAIAIDQAQRNVVLVQSKWDGSGDGGLGLGDARNFIAGFKDLTDMRYRRFTKALQAKQDEIARALDDPRTRFTLVVATTGRAELARPVRQAFDDLLREVNEVQEYVTVEVIGLSDFHAMIAEGVDNARIDLNVFLENWGTIGEPHLAFYGVMAGSSLVAWYDRHGDRLFSKNIRMSLGRTPVNDSLLDTLRTEPHNFWYYNNGVTALCESVQKKAKGGATRTYGEFALSGVSVVNGAQTVVSLHEAAQRHPECVESARVWVRLISLESCPKDFAVAVTRATNTQNTVESRDFVALDPEQTRLRTEMVLSLKKTYAIRRGESMVDSEHGCTVEEATVALACASRETELSVLAKSRIGALWKSTENVPYLKLFNPTVGPYRLWRCVQVLRAVDLKLRELRRRLEGKDHSVAVQGNRLVLHLVFRGLDLQRVDDAECDWEAELAKVNELTQRVLGLLTREVDATYGGNYIPTLFKNAAKCKELVEKVRARM